MRTSLCIAFAAAMATAGTAQAAALRATASSGDRSATAIFDRVGDDLVIKITNTSNSDAVGKSDLLTGLYFDASDSLSLKYVGAATASDSRLVGGSGSVSRGWTFNGGPPLRRNVGMRYGVGAASLDGNFRGTRGRNFALTTAGDDASTGLRRPLVKNSIVIVLDGLGASFDPENDITKVVFQYGTKLRQDPRLMADLDVVDVSLEAEARRVRGSDARRNDPAATPAPTALLGGLALLGVLVARRRKPPWT